MKRVIKFRAWDNISKKMFYPEGLNAFHIYHEGSWDLLEDNSAIHPDEVQYLTKDTSDGEMSKWWDGVLMQFTGLQDKNGVEIYEGDIIRSVDTGYEYIVVYEKGIFRGEQQPKIMAWIHPHDFCNNAIIGNIYQPELI